MPGAEAPAEVRGGRAGGSCQPDTGQRRFPEILGGAFFVPYPNAYPAPAGVALTGVEVLRLRIVATQSLRAPRGDAEMTAVPTRYQGMMSSHNGCGPSAILPVLM